MGVLYHAWAFFQARLLERRVVAEEAMYRRRAAVSGLNYSEALVVERLRAALRGDPTRRLPDRPRVFALVRVRNWERDGLLWGIGQESSGLTHFDPILHGFDEEAPTWERDRTRFNKHLIAEITRCHATQPIDLFFSYASGRMLDRLTIANIRAMGIVTVGFSLDDRQCFWGVRSNGRWEGIAPLASSFHLCWTSAHESASKYLVEGGTPLVMPEAANPTIHRPYPEENRVWDVGFAGKCYGARPRIVRYLSANGIRVHAVGEGWPGGPVSTEEMVRTYSRSVVTLGFGGIAHSSRILNVKGRDFEVPMSGGLYLTQANSQLFEYFRPGAEIVFYTDRAHLLREVRRLMSTPSEADAIRRAARTRALAEHSWTHRFRKLFATIQSARG